MKGIEAIFLYYKPVFHIQCDPIHIIRVAEKENIQ